MWVPSASCQPEAYSTVEDETTSPPVLIHEICILTKHVTYTDRDMYTKKKRRMYVLIRYVIIRHVYKERDPSGM